MTASPHVSQDTASGADWYQLTYTSADAPGMRGGWGVKDATSDIPATVRETLERNAPTQLDEVHETSQYASSEVLAQRPRRLLFRVVQGRQCLWHTVTAGLDATGRPGNVFTHAAAQRHEDHAVRPIEYWRSPGWLTPFGANEMSGARLGRLDPRAVVSRESVVRFLREDDRLYALEWLVAAVEHAEKHDVLLVLATRSADEAAMWIAAIGYLTSPAQAAAMSWVTYERAADLDAATRLGVRLAGMPVEDLDAALETAGARRLVVDPSWTFDDPGQGADWRYGDQSFPAAHASQNAVLDLFALTDDALQQVLTRVDEIAGHLSPDLARSLPVHWTLTLALLAQADAVVSSRDSLMAAVFTTVPRSRLPEPVLRIVADDVLRRLDRQDTKDFALLDPEWGVLIADKADVFQVEDYLTEDWPHAERAPKVSSSEAMASLIAQLLPPALATGEQMLAGGDPAQVMPVAWLVSFGLTNVGDDQPLAAQLQALVPRLREVLPGQPPEAEIWRLHPELIPGRSQPQGDGAIQTARPAVQPTFAAGNPSESRASGESSLTARLQRLSGRAADSSEAWSSAPTGPVVPDPLQRLVELRAAAQAWTERAFALDDAILAAAGLGEVPLTEAPSYVEGDPDRAEGLLLDSRDEVRRAAACWLAVYATRADAIKQLAPESPALERAVSDFETDVVEAIAEFIVGLTDDQVARVLERSIFRDLDGSGPLGIPLPGGGKLGMAACGVAWPRIDLGRFRAIMAVAHPLLDQVRSQFTSEDVGRRVAALVEQPPQSTGGRFGRTGRKRGI